MPVKIPIGVDDFREMRREGYTFVDKSFFVRDVIDNASKVLLLPRPRRFGKTLNLSMLRAFLDISASDARTLFDGLSLSREDEHVWRHANRYPVIAMTFKEARSSTWEMTYAVVRDRIEEMFATHRAALEGGKLGPREEAVFRRILGGSATPVDYAFSLLHLSRALHAHHGEQAVILIDEYDAPIHAAYLGGYLPAALDFFRIFLGAGLEENPHFRKGVVTGILRVARENTFSGLNNLAVYSVLSHDFRTAFGFTEAEVKALLDQADFAESLDVARRWYNGYLFGGEVIYNPWSVLNFLSYRRRSTGCPSPTWRSDRYTCRRSATGCNGRCSGAASRCNRSSMRSSRGTPLAWRHTSPRSRSRCSPTTTPPGRLPSGSTTGS